MIAETVHGPYIERWQCQVRRSQVMRVPGSTSTPRLRQKMEHSTKKARTSAVFSAASTGSYVNIDETHAVHLARHFADLYERGRFTDLRVRHRTTAWPEGTNDCSTRPIASASIFVYAPRCGVARSCSRCTRAW